MENHGVMVVWFEWVKRLETAGKKGFSEKKGAPPASGAGGVRRESDE